MSNQLDFKNAVTTLRKSLTEIYFTHCDLELSREEDQLFSDIEEKMEHLGALINSHVVYSDKYLLVRANGEVSEVEIPKDQFHELVHELVGCEMFEFVSVYDGYIFVVDECGKIREDPKPINHYCSAYYAGTLHGDPIVGDVLIGKYGYVDFESDIVGLDADELRKWKLNVKITN